MNEQEYKKLYDLEETYWWFRGHRLISFMLIEKYREKSQNKILDVGCGTGINMTYLRKYGDVYGSDVSEEALKFCKTRGLKYVKISPAEKLDYQDNSFDIVTSFGVLCCVQDDFQALREMFRVCKPNGTILITTPAIEFLYSKLKTEHDLSQHTTRRHSKKRMSKIVESAGFEIQRLTHFNMFLCPIVIAFRVLKKIIHPNIKKEKAKSDMKPLPYLVNELLFSILRFEIFLIRRFNLPIGLTLICVAKKPIRNE